MNIERRNYIDLPSIEALENQRQKAVDELEIIDDKYVKCQECGELKPIITDSALMIRCHTSRISQLKSMIKQIEKYNIPSRGYPNHIARKEREELKELLEEEKKREITKRIPLYSSKLTGYRWYCSKCYEQEEQKQREKRNQVVSSLLTKNEEKR